MSGMVTDWRQGMGTSISLGEGGKSYTGGGGRLDGSVLLLLLLSLNSTNHDACACTLSYLNA